MSLGGPALTGGKEAPPRPIDLSARSVEAWVLREEDKNTLQKLWTEGAVHVHQDPAQPEDQGVDIKGNTLQMTWNPAGNFLVVTDEEDLATLLMDKMLIKGPEVNIDQATNKAWVYGSGAMRMESATDFQGKNMQQPVPLTVFWNKDMFFNGVYAEFRGGIQAEQGNARMAAQRLQVFFDRPISLKEGNRGDQAAKVRNLVCDKDVRVEETTYEARKLVKYQLLLATGLDVTSLEPEDDAPRPAKSNEGNLVRASGPGSLRIWQPGSSDPAVPTGPGPTLTAKPPPGSKPADEEMKLTYVSFQKRMDANSKTNTANFWENVRVLNIPSDTPHREIDLDAIIARELPEGSLYLRCDRLKVLNQPENGRNNQQMEAHGRVWLQGKLYFGRAAAVYFNEAKDQVIFDGEDGTATLTKQAEPGGKVEVMTGRKILYYRRTGAATVVDSDQLNGIQRPN